MNVAFERPRPEPVDLRRYYENQALNAIRAIVSYWWLIGLYAAGALMVAGALIAILPRSYTAEAVVEPLKFLLSEDSTRTRPVASIDGTALVASEARLIDSLRTARAVVARLDIESEGRIARGVLRGQVERLKSAILPESSVHSEGERIARALQKRLKVDHDRRSYLITIAFTASDPDEAARIANAFALEYVSIKRSSQFRSRLTAARENLVQLSTLYGEKHPKFIEASASLRSIEAKIGFLRERLESVAEGNGDIDGVTLAAPVTRPSGPKGLVIIGLALLAALVGGAATALWLDRRDLGFATAEEVEAYTGVRASAFLPATGGSLLASGTSDATDAAREALRFLAVGTRLIGEQGGHKLVQVTGVEFDDDSDRVASLLAEVLVAHGRSVLRLHTSPLAADARTGTLEEMIAHGEADGEDNMVAPGMLAIYGPPAEAVDPEYRQSFNQRELELLNAARRRYDVAIVVTSAVVISADAALIARKADLSLLVAKWRRTPKKDVIEAAERLQHSSMNALVLTDAAAASDNRTAGILRHLRHVRRLRDQRLPLTERVRSRALGLSRKVREGFSKPAA